MGIAYNYENRSSVAIKKIRENISDYFEVRQFMERPDFSLVEEYNNVKAYYNELKSNTKKETKKEQESDELFDD